MPNTFLQFVWHYVKAYRWIFMGLFLLVSITGLYGTFISYLIKTLIDSMVALGEKATPQAIVSASFVPAILFILNYEIHDLLWRGVEYINLKTAPKIRNNIIEQLFLYVYQQPLLFFQKNLSGAISNNMMVLVDNIEKVMHNSLLYVLTTIIQLMVALCAMYSVNLIFSVGLFIWVVLFLIVRFSLAPRAKALSHDYAHSQSMVSGQLVNSFQTINLSGSVDRNQPESIHLLKYLTVTKEKFVRKESFVLMISICQGLSISALISFMLFFLIQLKSKNLVSIGDFALILGLVLTITKNMWTLTKHIDIINDAMGKCNQSLRMLVSPIPQKTGVLALDYS